MSDEQQTASSEGSDPSGAHGRSVWWFRGLLLALLVVGLVSTLNRRHGDLPVYTQAVDRASAGEEAYVRETSAFTHPPAQLTFFAVFAPVPDGARKVLFYAINVALLAGILVMLQRIARAEFRTAGRNCVPVWFWVFLLLVVGRHLTSPLENQSNDLPILFCLTATAFLRGQDRDVTGGMASGAATALKATPLLYLPILVWHRRFGGVLGFVAAAVLLSLSPNLFFPRADGMLWVQVWYETFVAGNSMGGPAEASGGWLSWNILNQSLSGTIFRLSRPETVSPDALRDYSIWNPSGETLRLVQLAVKIAVLGLIALAVGPPSAGDEDAPDRRMRRLGEVGAVACGMVLLSPMSSKAHFCVLILSSSYMLLHLYTRGRDVLVVAALALAFVLGTLTSKGIAGVPIGEAMLARGSVTWCAVVVLLGTIRVARVRRRLDAGSAGALSCDADRSAELPGDAE